MKRPIWLLTALFAGGVVSAGVVIPLETPSVLPGNWQHIGRLPLIPGPKFCVEDSAASPGGKRLIIQSKSASGMIIHYPKIDLKKYPIMRWRWRLVKPLYWAPEQGFDDQAVAIYIGDGSAIKQRSVSYRWEVHVPVGETRKLMYSGGAIQVGTICLRNFSTPTGEWVTEERNVLADYRSFYGAEMNPTKHALVIGANSQHCRQFCHAEIDGIEFLSEEEARANPLPKPPKQ